MADRIENPFGAVVDTVKERIHSPITGVFLLTWFIVNWKILVLLIYERVPKVDRLTELQVYLESSTWRTLLLYPVGLSIVYLFALPLLREKYSNWLKRSEFRISRYNFRIERDLKEINDYGTTVISINHYLIGEFEKYSKNSEYILDHLAGMKEQTTENNSIKTSLVEIHQIIKADKEKMDKDIDEMKWFFGTYSGTLPERYKHYIKMWSKTSNK